MTSAAETSPRPPPRRRGRAPGAGAASAQNLPAAAIWMAVALTSFIMMAVSGRAAGQSVDTMHLMFYRSAIALVIVSAMILASRRGFGQVTTRRLGLHAVRNAIHFIAQFSWFYALMMITLAQLSAVEFTAPLWVAVIAPLVLGERLTAARVVAALLGFIGILVVVRPGMVPVGPGTMLAMVAAIGYACSMVATKRLVVTETILAFLFHMSWMQLVMAAIAIGPRLSLPGFEALPWVAGVALFGLSAHFALARAFTHADAMIVAPMDFLRLPLIMGVGVVVYGEPLEAWVLAGAAIVIAANTVNLVGERRKAGG